jgi:hypothetical protein
MSSVRSLFASSAIGPVERRLRSVGRVADDNSSSAFAVKPASAAQDPEADASPPDDPVVIAVDATRAVEAAQPAQVTSPDASAADEAIPPALTAYNVAQTSQAARAYAQVMQAWLASKRSRPAPSLRRTQSQARPDR